MNFAGFFLIFFTLLAPTQSSAWQADGHTQMTQSSILQLTEEKSPGLFDEVKEFEVNFYRAGFNFALVPCGNLGNTFRFSLLLKF